MKFPVKWKYPFGLFFIQLLQQASANNEDPTASACGLLGQKVYCYGGGFYQQAISNFTMLDLSTLNFNAPTFQWTTVTPNVTLQPNQQMQVMSFNNNQGIMWYGGTGSQSAPYNLVAPMMTLENDGLSRFTNLDSLLLDPTSYTAESSLVDMLPLGRSQMWIIGGFFNKSLANATLNAPANITNADRYPASPMIQIFDYVAASWIAPPANSNGLNGYSRYSHTSTLTQDGSAVYLLGGWLLNLYNASDAHWLMNANEIWAYDMKSYQWKNITATSTSNVEARWHHTAIAVPNTTWIILYGGYSMVGWSVIPLQSKNQTQTLMIYDWSDNSYKFPNLTNLYYGPPDSQENSGFLYTDPSTKKNYAVYFLGSRNPAVGNPLTSILDISIPTQMTWILNGTSSSSSSSLSGGAIAGIAVGSIAGGAIVCGAIILFLVRRNKKRSDFKVQASDPRNQDFAEMEMVMPDRPTSNEFDDVASYTNLTSTADYRTNLTGTTDLDTATTLTNNHLGPVKPDGGADYRMVNGKYVEKPVKPFSDESNSWKPSADE